jgi:hypothetical protein
MPVRLSATQRVMDAATVERTVLGPPGSGRVLIGGNRFQTRRVLDHAEGLRGRENLLRELVSADHGLPTVMVQTRMGATRLPLS